MRRVAHVLVVTMLFAGSSSAGELDVPAAYPTLQAAIDAAESGDTIRLADGTYTGPGFVALDFLGKELLVEAAPGACLIDCDGVRFARLGAAEAGGVQLRGLKVLFGQANQGGALLCEDGAVLEARDCIFEHGFATLGGGAAHVRNGASATFRGCAFLGCTAQNGGALRVTAASLLVEHGTFSHSSAVSKGGAVSVAQGGTATLRDCILQQDNAPNGAELQADGAGSLITITYSDVLGGFLATNATAEAHLDWGAGMIDGDPLIVDVPDDLHLQPGSPCINTGDPAGPQDADGSPPDMGALPYPTWTSLGGGIAGTFGVPVLSANGPLTSGSLLRWSVTHGWPGHAVTLVVGFEEAGAPFQGGVLWPVPHVLMGFVLDADGASSGAGHWPHGVPAGAGLWLQAWFVDAGAVGGLAASNGMKGIAP